MGEPFDAFEGVASLPGVAAVAERARGAVDAVLFERVLMRRADEVATEVRLRSARASAELEGAPASLADLRTGAAFELESVGSVASAAVRVADESASLIGVWERAPAQALARLHTVAASDFDAVDLGRPRDDDEVRGRLGGLMELLVAPTAAPAVVVAAIVHGELLALAPFGTRDGLVARAAWRIVLVSRGLDTRAVTVPEEGLVRLGRQQYAEALEAYRSGTPDGVSAWVAHCCAAVEIGAAEGLDVCREVATRA